MNTDELEAQLEEAQKQIQAAECENGELRTALAKSLAHSGAGRTWREVDRQLTSLQQQRDEAQKQVARLEECLEPGKANAINAGLFKTADRLGLHHSSVKHALTLLEEEILNLRKQVAHMLSVIETARNHDHADGDSTDCVLCAAISSVLDTSTPSTDFIRSGRCDCCGHHNDFTQQQWVCRGCLENPSADFIHKRELLPTIELLKRYYCPTTLTYEATQKEIKRLEQLTKQEPTQ